VVVLRYFPEDVDERDARHPGPLLRPALQGDERAPARRGKAILVVTGPRSPNAGETGADDLRHRDRRLGDRRGFDQRRWPPRCSRRSRPRPGSPRSGARHGNPHVVGFALPGVEVELDVAIGASGAPATTCSPAARRPARRGQAVGGFSSAPTTTIWGAGPRQLAGAQGGGRDRSTTAPTTTRRAAAVLEVARGLAGVAATPPRGARVVVGRGARPARLDRLRASGRRSPRPGRRYLNFDMVGRCRTTSSSCRRRVEPGVAAAPRAGQRPGRLRPVSSRTIPTCPPTARAFYNAGVPCLNFFTGGHEDYHRPTDTAEKINYEDLARVASFRQPGTPAADLDEADRVHRWSSPSDRARRA
jgi:hypothetical protein